MSKSEYIASLKMAEGSRIGRQVLINGIPMSEWVKRDKATAAKVAAFKATRRPKKWWHLW